MTSRERVLTAFSHKEPDMVPIDFGAMGSTGIMAVAFNELKKHLGVTDDVTRLCDWGQQLAEPPKWLLDMFEVDIIGLGRSIAPVDDPDAAAEYDAKWGGEWKPWTLPDGSECVCETSFNPESDGEGGWYRNHPDGRLWCVMPKGCLYFDAGPEGYHQLQDVESIEDLADWHPGKMTEESLAGTVEKAKWLHDNTDYAVMTGFGGSILESGQGLRGWGQFMMDMAGDRPLAEEIIGRLTEAHVHNAKVFMAALGDYIQVVQMGDDLGTQDGPQMSPQLYHDLIHPAHKAIYQAAKSAAPQVAIFLHSCGSIRSLIPDLIDEGVELLNPVQTAAADMDPKELNDEYGDKLTFWGGSDGQRANRDFRPRWRLCLQSGPQHPGRSTACKHHSHVRSRKVGAGVSVSAKLKLRRSNLTGRK